MQTDKGALLTYVFYFMDQARHPGKKEGAFEKCHPCNSNSDGYVAHFNRTLNSQISLKNGI
jgi:hypothetical protein